MDDLYSSSPRSDISITSIESNSSVSSRKNKRKNKKKHSYQDFIREETNLFEVFNKDGSLVLNKDDAKKQLIELKEYLDLGIITQEEFDKKAESLKKILLGN